MFHTRVERGKWLCDRPNRETGVRDGDGTLVLQWNQPQEPEIARAMMWCALRYLLERWASRLSQFNSSVDNHHLPALCLPISRHPPATSISLYCTPYSCISRSFSFLIKQPPWLCVMRNPAKPSRLSSFTEFHHQHDCAGKCGIRDTRRSPLV